MNTMTQLKIPRSFWSRTLLAIGYSLLLQACGGGGGGNTAPPLVTHPPPPPSSSPTAVTTSGIITAFGSVFVNGVEYETDSAEIESDDDIADEGDLKVGQIITLKGSVNDDGVTGTADSIVYDDKVEGPITSINGDILVVLQHTIILNGTVFDDNVPTQSVAGLTVGDVIEVSGFLNANGDIVATYLELDNSGSDFELVGIVSNLDTDDSTFDIGPQTISYASATFEDFDGALIADDDLVEVKGNSFDGDGAFVAIEIELEDDDFDENDEVEVEGLITRFESELDFDVFAVMVTTTSTTEYEGGTADDLAEDVKVEVEGTIENGILVAEKVEFKNVEDTRFEAVVDSVAAEAGEFVILGVTIVVPGTAQLEDDSDLDEMFFGLDDMVAGNFVEVRGKLEGDGTVTATRVERDDMDDETFVRGLVQSNDGAGTLVIAGVTILTNPETEYRNVSEMSMTEADFFLAAQVGVEVKAKGQETDVSEITARQLELEDD